MKWSFIRIPRIAMESTIKKKSASGKDENRTLKEIGRGT